MGKRTFRLQQAKSKLEPYRNGVFRIENFTSFPSSAWERILERSSALHGGVPCAGAGARPPLAQHSLHAKQSFARRGVPKLLSLSRFGGHDWEAGMGWLV